MGNSIKALPKVVSEGEHQRWTDSSTYDTDWKQNLRYYDVLGSVILVIGSATWRKTNDTFQYWLSIQDGTSRWPKAKNTLFLLGGLSVFHKELGYAIWGKRRGGERTKIGRPVIPVVDTVGNLRPGPNLPTSKSPASGSRTRGKADV